MTRPEEDFEVGAEPEVPGESQDEVLVAYLDGQLPADQSERIEARLADDPSVRERLQSLDRVWNALDVLPRSTASPAFTRSTVEMAAVSPASDETKVTGRGWRPPIGGLVGVLALACGAAASFALRTAPERRALRELPVALAADALENLGTLAFAEQLLDQADKSLGRFRSGTTEAEARRWAELARMTPVERRDWLEDQPADVVSEVSEAIDRFEDRPPAKQEALRSLSGEIAASDRAEALRDAAVAYQAMVGRLTPGEQAALRQSDPAERLTIVRRSARGWAFDVAMELSDAERATFRAAVERLVSTDEFRRVGERFARRLPGGRDRPEPSPQAVLFGATRLVAADPLSRWPAPRGRFEEERERIETRVEAVQRQWRDWFDVLSPSLPDRIRTQLGRAETDAPRARLFERLLGEAMTEDLQMAFAELSNDQMQQALLAPRDQFVEELSGPDDNFGELFGPPPGGPPAFDSRRTPGSPRGRGSRREGFPGGPPPRGEGRGRPPR